MKKAVILITLLTMLLTLVGCDDNRTQTDGYIEWISPDGVHYWDLYNQLAPRYDHDGNLVIEE